MQSYQLPSEKRVVESGVKWPAMGYKEASAEELVDQALASLENKKEIR